MLCVSPATRADQLPHRRRRQGAGERRPRRPAGPLPDTWSCAVCGELPATEFHASVIADRKHACKACIHARNDRHARERPEVYAARRARNCAGPGSEDFSARDAAAVLDRFGHRCAMTGFADVPLSIVAVDPARPLGADNAAPVWRCMAPELGRMGRARRMELLLAGAVGGPQVGGAQARGQRAAGGGDKSGAP